MDKYDYLYKIHQLEQEVFRLDKESWFKFELFTFEWWILVAFFIVPWLIWIKLADRRKMIESLLFGSLVIIITTLLDSLGLQFEFWVYPTQLVPVVPRAIPFDMSMVPVLLMLVYQYFDTWKRYIVALIVLSVIIAFVGEPISVKLELVKYLNWHYIYSFFYYITLGILIRAFIIKLKANALKK